MNKNSTIKMDKQYRLSIITVNLNNLEGLKRTMQSVFEQSWREFEYIVIDGGSTDSSREYIEVNAQKIDYWVSEPDTGIYSAMNKGIKVANGEYLLFLNSGDWLHNNNTLHNVTLSFSKDYSIYYGDVIRIYENNKKVKKSYPAQLSFSFFMDSSLAHQAVFIKRTLFYELFFYNEDYRVLADWEFLIVAICKFNVKTYYLNNTIANYPMNGISSSENGRKVMIKEREKCYHEHFPLFIEDYRRTNKLERIFDNNRVRMFLKLDSRPKTRKILYFFMRVLDKILSRYKKIKS